MKNNFSLRKALALAALFLGGMASNLSATVTITVSSDAISAGVNYNTIQAAYNYVKALPALTEPYIIELQSTYNPASGVTTETFPITFTANTASAANNITIKPAANAKITLSVPNQTVIATNLSFSANASAAATIDLTGKITVGDISMITSNSYIAGLGTYIGGTFKKVTSVAGNVVTVPTAAFASAQTGVTLYFGNAQTKVLYFNGGDYITIDGVSRTDVNTGLTLQNPNCIYAQTILFDNNSNYNTIKNCIVRGANQSGAWNNGFQGTIYFAGAQYNTINSNDVCDMNDANIPYPICAFQMTAAGGTNNNQTITNNNIYNISNRYSGNGNYAFMQFGSDAASTNNNISFNRFYWTAPTTYRTNSTNFFAFATIGLGNRFEGNIIGYGAADGTGKSTLTFTGTGGTTYAIGGMKNAVCKNNIVGGIDIVGTTFVGLQLAPHTTGSTVPADSICYGNQVKDISVNCAANGTLYGLFFSAAPFSNVNVKNNIVKNLTISSSTSTVTSTIYGMSANFAASGTIAINSVGNEFSNLTAGKSGSSASNIVTAFMSGGCNVLFEKNLIYNLNAIGNRTAVSSTYSSGGAAAATTMTVASATGMTVGDLITGTGVQPFTIITAISTNTLTLSKALTAQASGTYTSTLLPTVKGIRLAVSTTDGKMIKNNIIRLGTDVTSDAEISAIIDEGLSSNGHALNVYHNSIYIGGTSQTLPSHCFNHSSGANYGNITLKNNIFSNVRSGGAAVNQVFNMFKLPVIATSSNNLYQYGSTFATKTLASSVPATYATLAAWNTARTDSTLSTDANSIDQVSPSYVDPTATTPDLRINANSNVVDAVGANLSASVSDDFYGSARSGLTPHDLGAYAYANTLPTVTIDAPSVAATTAWPVIPVTITFSSAVEGFTAEDIVVSNATLADFTPVSSTEYTANLNVTTDGVNDVIVTANIAKNVTTAGNNAASQFTRTFSVATGAALIKESASVYASRGAVVISAAVGQKVTIFSATGQLLKTVKLTSDNVSVPMAKGFYVVFANGHQTKVLVK